MSQPEQQIQFQKVEQLKSELDRELLVKMKEPHTQAYWLTKSLLEVASQLAMINDKLDEID